MLSRTTRLTLTCEIGCPARPIYAQIAKRAETALLEKRRRAPSPRIQQWLIEELEGIYRQAHGVDFPASSRRGPGIRFVQTCVEYTQLVEIERELRWARSKRQDTERSVPRSTPPFGRDNQDATKDD
jgi:hypothetical protein